MKTNYIICGLAAIATIAVGGCATTSKGVDNSASNDLPKVNPDKLLVVDCLLPGQVRKLGSKLTYLTPRRPAKTTAVDCEIRGGDYVAFDRSDYRTALNVWLPEAKNGSAAAQTYVGEIFEKGLGTEPNFAIAADWYQKAAVQGYSRAQLNLGYLYEKGLGVERDRVKSLNWYRAASGLEGDDIEFASTLEAEVAAAQEEIELLRGQVARNKRENESLTRKLEDTQTQLAQRKSGLQAAENQVASLELQLSQRLEVTDVDLDDAEVQTLQSELEAQQGLVAQQREALAALEANFKAQRERLTADAEAARRQETLLQEKLAGESRESQALRSQLAEAEARLTSAQQKVSSLNSEVEQERQALAALQQGMPVAGARIRTLEEQLAEQNRKVGLQNQEMVRLQKISEQERKKFEQKLATESERSKALKQQLAQADNQLATEQARLDQLTAQLQQEQQRQDGLQAGASSDETKLADLRRQLSKQQQKVKTQHEEMAWLQNELEQQREQFDSELKASRETERQLALQIAGENRRGEALRAQLAEAKQQLSQERDQLASLTSALEEERAKLQRARKGLQTSAASEAEAARLRTQLERREKELQQQQVELAALEAETLDYRERLKVADNAQTTPGTTLATLAGPSIEILDPPVALTRSEPTVRLRSITKDRLIVGKVGAPAGLLSFTVNDQIRTLDRQGIFRVNVPVAGEKTPVNAVAIDKQGRRAAINFSLIPPQLQVVETPALTTPSPNKVNLPAGRPSVEFGQYYALIIGNNEYRHFPKLESAVNDAKRADEVLRENYGFKTKLLINADRYAILSALNDMREQLTDKDNLLLYYAGHGELDRVNLRGHWLPVDAEPGNTANWISNVAVTDILNTLPAKHVLVVADSCYSGAMTRSSLARLDPAMPDQARAKWMKVMAKTRSRTVLTSGGLKPVLDSGSGGHSIFASAFFEILESNDQVLEGYGVYRKVTDKVQKAAAAFDIEQIPRYAPIKHGGHEAGEFFFVPLTYQS